MADSSEHGLSRTPASWLGAVSLSTLSRRVSSLREKYSQSIDDLESLTAPSDRVLAPQLRYLTTAFFYMGVLVIPNIAWNYRAQTQFKTMNFATGLEAHLSLGTMVRV